MSDRGPAPAAILRNRRSGRLAHPVTADPGQNNTITMEFIQALTSAAVRRNHHLVLAVGGAEGGDDVEELVRSGAADAVVLANVLPGDERVEALARHGVPFACFGRTEPHLPQSWVDVDNHAGAHEATTYLVGRGHTRVAFLGYLAWGGWDRERETGYRDAMAEVGLNARVVTPDPDRRSVQAAIAALLDSERPPTAIVTGSDVLAGGVYAAAAQRGVRVGADLAVIGFDGSVLGRVLSPTLTTVVIPVEHIADRVVARVLAELDGPTDEPGELVRPELICAASG